MSIGPKVCLRDGLPCSCGPLDCKRPDAPLRTVHPEIDPNLDPALLPCPFCGGRAALDFDPHHPAFPPKKWMAACGGDNCVGDVNTGWYPTREEAAAAWNRRAPTEAGHADQQLKVEAGGGLLNISIGVNVLAFAVQNGCPDWPPEFRIKDPAAFAADVVTELYGEQEDGSTPVHRMLDAAAVGALERGSEAVEDAPYEYVQERPE